MTTFGDVVDRVYRDWLHGPDEQPIVASLDDAVTDSDTTFVLDTTGLIPDELNAMSVGTLVEVGYEQALITSVTDSTLTVARGRNGTTAEAHADGDPVVLLPQWGRQTVLDAVLDEVPRLYPDLHRVVTTTVTSGSDYAEVPAEVSTITRAYVASSGRYYNTGGIELLTDFAPSSTGKAVQFRGVPSGRTVYLAYRAGFARPAGAAVELSTAGVDEAWVPIISVGAAASVVASEDVDKATVEFVTRQLESEQFPVGSSARLRDALLRYRQFLVEQARRTLRTEDVTAVQYLQASYP